MDEKQQSLVTIREKIDRLEEKMYRNWREIEECEKRVERREHQIQILKSVLRDMRQKRLFYFHDAGEL